MADIICFFMRYAPFWTIPIAFISAEFGYKYWLKRRTSVYRLSFGISFICFLITIFYIWVGGPEKSGHFLMKYLFN